MKICILSGSPKGENSITYQTILYLEALYPEHEFNVLHVGRGIKKFEADLSEAKFRLERCDTILFCYPVYTFLVPYQLHRFIELMKESGIKLSGKCACQISTSKRFYDVTAHRFIEDNCADMGLHYLGGLSLDMEDLLHEEGRRQVREFFDLLKYRQEKEDYVKPSVQKTAYDIKYKENNIYRDKKEGRKIVIVSAGESEDTELSRMIADFRNAFVYESEVVSLCEYPFKGGCLGCMNCAGSGRCIYTDGFDTFLRKRYKRARR